MSEQYQQYSPYPPYQGWQPQPPRPKHTVRNVLLACGAGFLALVVSCSALVAADGDSAGAAADPVPTVTVTAPAPLRAGTTQSPPPKPVATATRPAEPSKAAQPLCSDDKNEPCTVKAGQTFTQGKHQTLAGWKVRRGPLDWIDVVAKVKNISDEESSAFVTFKFLRGNEVLASVMCTSSPLEPGQSQLLNRLSGDDYTTRYDRITVEATF